MPDSTSDAWKVLVPRNSLERSKQRKQQSEDARLLKQSPLPIQHKFDRIEEPLTQEDQSTMSAVQRDSTSPYGIRSNPWVSSKHDIDVEDGDELANQDDDLAVHQVNLMARDHDMEYQFEQICRRVCDPFLGEIKTLTATVERQKLEIENLRVQVHTLQQNNKLRHDKYIVQIKMLFENQQTLDEQLNELRRLTGSERTAHVETKIQELAELVNGVVARIK